MKDTFSGSTQRDDLLDSLDSLDFTSTNAFGSEGDGDGNGDFTIGSNRNNQLCSTCHSDDIRGRRGDEYLFGLAEEELRAET